MKPNWKDAPDWAQWLAQDQDESWYWYEREPKHDDEEWYAGGLVSSSERDWRNTLEPRPDET